MSPIYYQQTNNVEVYMKTTKETPVDRQECWDHVASFIKEHLVMQTIAGRHFVFTQTPKGRLLDSQELTFLGEPR